MFDRSLYLNAAQDLRTNVEQWAAYESTGNCVVLAGPGSGKTKILAIKLARILSEDVQEPRGVACITYNNECVHELEQRLEALGIEASKRVFIGTVHSFSLTQIVIPYAKVAGLGLPNEFRVANQKEQKGAFERAYNQTIARSGNSNQNWRWRMDLYRRGHLDRTSAAFQRQNPECANLVITYEEELHRHGLIDFDDMPLLAVRALRENAWLKEAIKAKYPFLVVDEYQDLGLALHQMVMELSFGSGIRLFAVGDIDQSIYGFTGARPELLRCISERADVETVKLKLNYRCGSKIVMASQFALGKDRGYEVPEGAADGEIHFYGLTGCYEQQAEWLFRTLIPSVINRLPNLELGDVAILYPAAWIGDAVANASQVHSYGIIRADRNAVFPRSNKLIRWLELCAIWCCIGWKSGKPRFSRLVDEGFRIFAEALSTEDTRLEFNISLMRFLWANRKSSLMLHTWLTDVNQDLLNPIFSRSRILADEEEALGKLICKTSPGKECGDISIGQFCGNGEGNNRIHLSTFHSSKGHEFRVAILFGMDNGRIPRNGATEQEIREARRLFYVGFTRAKEDVHILFSKNRPSRLVMELCKRISGT